ncbi:MAG: BMP family ABC transporter substrate-binding protein [Desulfurococcales archaeon]|nr:BMP family ABC transporter substrate-binding protein [Desulfurococcales archaeon]
MDRRDFLKASAGLVAGLALGAVGGYTLGASKPGGETQAGAQASGGGGSTVKALWIYVGPIGDYGWTHAHHIAKERVAEHGWVEAAHLEKVPETQAYDVIKAQLDQGGYNAVFATSYGYMEAIKRLAPQYPEVKFYHCSGPWEEFREHPNVSTYFAEFYQLYYLNGVAAGAVTESCKLGYIPAFLIPEVVRHINAFALGAIHGARVAGKCGGGSQIEVLVAPPLNSWFAPDKARAAAKTLVDQYGVDVLAYTEDSTATIEAAEEYWAEGSRVYSFSHYSDMTQYYKSQGRELRSHLTGQIADWSPIYYILLATQATGGYRKIDVWARLGDYVPIRWRNPKASRAGSPEGAVYLAPLNRDTIPPRALEEIIRLYEDMKELLYEPFTGPLRGYQIDEQGRPQEEARLKVAEGSRLGRDELWYMDWFHESVQRI